MSRAPRRAQGRGVGSGQRAGGGARGGPREGGAQPGREGQRAGGRGGRGARNGSTRDARVVWPPAQRFTARDAIEQLMRDRGLARGFEGAVERAARKARAAAGLPVGGGGEQQAEGGAELHAGGVGLQAGVGVGPARRDLRELATFTIDPAAARDFDDALSAEWNDRRRAVRVWVHIADVAAHVREGSPIDIEARLRSTSVYVPGGVEPMLPAALSNDACSLVPGRDRLAVTVELEIALDPSAAGRRASARFYRSLIRSDARLDYDRVDRIFAGAERAAEPWAASLDAARAAARVLREQREARASALALDSEEPEFEIDEHGEVRAIVARVATESHHLIEHLMIAANEAVAEHLAAQRTPCLYRVHERPEVAGVLRLVDQLASLGVPTPPVPAQLSRSQAAALVGECSHAVERHVRHTLARAHAGDRTLSPTGGRRALTTLVLRALQPAHYTPANLGHAGLASTCYCHFTSPIRRYPDLVCHRALLSSIGHAERPPRVEELVELGEWCSERERFAMEIERDADDVARCFALERHLYDHAAADDDDARSFAGEVVGLISAGAFIAFGGSPAGGGGGGDGERSGAERSVSDIGPGGDDGSGFRYEGFLPVRRLAAALAGDDARRLQDRDGGGGGDMRDARARRGVAQDGRSARARRGVSQDGRSATGREWWELNEHGTILHGERSGATLRLGDPIAVRVDRVDAPRGRVDLAPVDANDDARSGRRSSPGAGRRSSGARKSARPGR